MKIMKPLLDADWMATFTVLIGGKVTQSHRQTDEWSLGVRWREENLKWTGKLICAMFTWQMGCVGAEWGRIFRVSRFQHRNSGKRCIANLNVPQLATHPHTWRSRSTPTAFRVPDVISATWSWWRNHHMTADIDSVLFDFSHQGSEVRSLVFVLLNVVAAESQSVLRFLHDRTGRVTLNRDPLPGQRASWLAVRYSSALLWASRALMV